EIPPYFPHSATMRLDTNPATIIETEKLVPQTDWRGDIKETSDVSYDAPTSIVIDGKPFITSFHKNNYDEMYAMYCITATEHDLQTEYDELVRYFSKIYGKGQDCVKSDSAGAEFFTTIAEKKWSFKIDTEKVYLVDLLYTTDKNEGQYFITVGVGRDDT
ncbi:MAG: hypothetical protein RSD23_05030, partial [Ruthenibacterium sp.]